MIERTGSVRRKPRNKKKLEIFCKMTKNAVDEGVIFEENKIVEILPW